MTNQIIAYYLIIINIVTFLVYGIDKWKARKAMWRVREAIQKKLLKSLAEYIFPKSWERLNPQEAILTGLLLKSSTSISLHH